jgi:uncharacterized protein with GYD domain
MSTFMLSMNFTDQGIRTIKDVPNRVKVAHDLADKMGVDIKQVYLTTGDTDVVAIVEASPDDRIIKFAMALGSIGNVRTRTSRAWTEAEYIKMTSELP